MKTNFINMKLWAFLIMVCSIAGNAAAETTKAGTAEAAAAGGAAGVTGLSIAAGITQNMASNKALQDKSNAAWGMITESPGAPIPVPEQGAVPKGWKISGVDLIEMKNVPPKARVTVEIDAGVSGIEEGNNVAELKIPVTNDILKGGKITSITPSANGGQTIEITYDNVPGATKSIRYSASVTNGSPDIATIVYKSGPEMEPVTEFKTVPPELADKVAPIKPTIATATKTPAPANVPVETSGVKPINEASAPEGAEMPVVTEAKQWMGAPPPEVKAWLENPTNETLKAAQIAAEATKPANTRIVFLENTTSTAIEGPVNKISVISDADGTVLGSKAKPITKPAAPAATATPIVAETPKNLNTITLTKADKVGLTTNSGERIAANVRAVNPQEGGPTNVRFNIPKGAAAKFVNGTEITLKTAEGKTLTGTVTGAQPIIGNTDEDSLLITFSENTIEEGLTPAPITTQAALPAEQPAVATETHPASVPVETSGAPAASAPITEASTPEGTAPAPATTATPAAANVPAKTPIAPTPPAETPAPAPGTAPAITQMEAASPAAPAATGQKIPMATETPATANPTPVKSSTPTPPTTVSDTETPSADVPVKASGAPAPSTPITKPSAPKATTPAPATTATPTAANVPAETSVAPAPAATAPDTTPPATAKPTPAATAPTPSANAPATAAPTELQTPAAGQAKGAATQDAMKAYGTTRGTKTTNSARGAAWQNVEATAKSEGLTLKHEQILNDSGEPMIKTVAVAQNGEELAQMSQSVTGIPSKYLPISQPTPVTPAPAKAPGNVVPKADGWTDAQKTALDKFKKDPNPTQGNLKALKDANIEVSIIPADDNPGMIEAFEFSDLESQTSFGEDYPLPKPVPYPADFIFRDPAIIAREQALNAAKGEQSAALAEWEKAHKTWVKAFNTNTVQTANTDTLEAAAKKFNLASVKVEALNAPPAAPAAPAKVPPVSDVPVRAPQPSGVIEIPQTTGAAAESNAAAKAPPTPKPGPAARKSLAEQEDALKNLLANKNLNDPNLQLDLKAAGFNPEPIMSPNGKSVIRYDLWDGKDAYWAVTANSEGTLQATTFNPLETIISPANPDLQGVTTTPKSTGYLNKLKNKLGLAKSQKPQAPAPPTSDVPVEGAGAAGEEEAAAAGADAAKAGGEVVAVGTGEAVAEGVGAGLRAAAGAAGPAVLVATAAGSGIQEAIDVNGTEGDSVWAVTSDGTGYHINKQ